MEGVKVTKENSWSYTRIYGLPKGDKVTRVTYEDYIVEFKVIQYELGHEREH